MNLDIIIKKLTKKQLRKLVLAQELDRKHQLAFAQELDRKHQLAFENLKRIENLKKEDEDEGGDEDYCEYCGEKIEECLEFADCPDRQHHTQYDAACTYSQELDRKHQLAFENLKRIENLKKEDEDEGGEVWQYLDTLT
jgi:hypothetical protein